MLTAELENIANFIRMCYATVYPIEPDQDHWPIPPSKTLIRVQSRGVWGKEEASTPPNTNEIIVLNAAFLYVYVFIPPKRIKYPATVRFHSICHI